MHGEVAEVAVVERASGGLSPASARRMLSRGVAPLLDRGLGDPGQRLAGLMQ